MTDPEVDLDAVEQVGEAQNEESRGRRSRVALAIILLLLLLLCVVTTTVDVWVNRDPDTVRFIARNLECLQCHEELIPQLSFPTVHDPFLKKECTVCHTPHGKEVTYKVTAGGSKTIERVRMWFEWLPLKFVFWAWDGVATLTGHSRGGQVVEQGGEKIKGETSQLTMPEAQLCWVCHGDLGPQMAMPYGHNPFKKGYCTTCHNPHASKHRALLTQDERDLCVTCHPIGAELARAQTHPPAAGFFCLNCHNPHASNYKGILTQSQRDLCFMCHPTVAPLSLKPVQHNPFQYDNCTGCHEPHGSDYMPLLIRSTPALCYDCHPAIARDFEKPSHHPVGTVRLRCEDCHNPHASDYPSLLTARNNSFCYQCHAVPIKVTFDKSAHFNTLCISCHTPHGSQYGPLLRKRNPELCLGCHGWIDQRNKHPFQPTYYDPLAKKALTCTTSCHDPHGTLNSEWMVKYAGHTLYQRPDGFCLQCHRQVGMYY